MPKNPFVEHEQFEPKQKRNSFDLSFQNNLTMKLGALYPVFCKEVNPGDSMEIDSAYNLQFMPMVFPVQTPMRANLHFFYVRNRNLWKNWKDFAYNNKKVTHPYISQESAAFFKTGSLADYLGVPSTLVHQKNLDCLLSLKGVFPIYSRHSYFGVPTSEAGTNSPIDGFSSIGQNLIPASANSVNARSYPAVPYRFRMLPGAPIYGSDGKPEYPFNYLNECVFAYNRVLESTNDITLPTIPTTSDYAPGEPMAVWQGYMTSQLPDDFDLSYAANGLFVRFDNFYDISSKPTTYHSLTIFPVIISKKHYAPDASNPGDEYIIDHNSLDVYVDRYENPVGGVYRRATFGADADAAQAFGEYIKLLQSRGQKVALMIAELASESLESGGKTYRNGGMYYFDPSNATTTGKRTLGTSVSFPVNSYVPEDLKDLSVLNQDKIPFVNPDEKENAIRINALPFRAYEAIYNAYYRDERNDPFIVDGEVKYNEYITTDDDGADSTPYHLFYRNYEKDFLTSATQSPQQGLAPLVGINYRGDLSFQNEDGTIAKIRPTIASDGETITGISGVLENGTPEAVRSALDLVSSGISINDFRQVNALQRWLENNIRRGYKYRDQVLANTGVTIRYDELDMPEFLGGISRPVQVSKITQTAADGVSPLGDFAGQANLTAGMKHAIRHYFDEAGFVIGIFCVTPQPAYSQLLPKQLLKSSPLDYYQQQFGHIGMQPISYREVCPVQAAIEGVDVNSTFGYQRPWYDLIASVDEVHGLMRTELKDFLMNRTFGATPELGADFLHVNPSELNQVFSVTKSGLDVIIGQIIFKCYAKRAIPRFGIPRLEA